MKTILFGLAAASAAFAAGLAEIRPVSIPDCCAAPISSTAAAPDPVPSSNPIGKLPARSLYQLDRVWTNDASERIQLPSLAGHPVVLAMFYSSCQMACPIMVNALKDMREQLPQNAREDTRFVLVSFDAVRDTPAALKAYREKMGLDSAWTLLHGDADSVRELAMLLGVKYKEDALGQFAHSNLFTVLNRSGEIVHQHNGLGGDVSEANTTLSTLASQSVQP